MSKYNILKILLPNTGLITERPRRGIIAVDFPYVARPFSVGMVGGEFYVWIVSSQDEKTYTRNFLIVGEETKISEAIGDALMWEHVVDQSLPDSPGIDDVPFLGSIHWKDRHGSDRAVHVFDLSSKVFP